MKFVIIKIDDSSAIVRVNSEKISISEMHQEIYFKMFPGYFEPEKIDGDLSFNIT